MNFGDGAQKPAAEVPETRGDPRYGSRGPEAVGPGWVGLGRAPWAWAPALPVDAGRGRPSPTSGCLIQCVLSSNGPGRVGFVNTTAEDTSRLLSLVRILAPSVLQF